MSVLSLLKTHECNITGIRFKRDFHLGLVVAHEVRLERECVWWGRMALR